MAEIYKRKYAAVSSSSTDSLSYTVPNGKKLYIFEMGASGGSGADTKIEIMFGTTGSWDILLATHGDFCCSHQRIECVGDGTDVVKILMTNGSGQTEMLGGYFRGEEY
jgi:hypothetical protein